MAMTVSDSGTVSDLKMAEHYEDLRGCAPRQLVNFFKKKKVKRRGYHYHLSDSMFVKSAFVRVIKNWFLSADASSVEEHRENRNSIKSDTGNVVTCFNTGVNNSSSHVVDIVPGDMAIRLSNVNDVSLPRVRDDCVLKENSFRNGPISKIIVEGGT